MSMPSLMSTRETRWPAGPVCFVTSVSPSMARAAAATSSPLLQIFTPPL